LANSFTLSAINASNMLMVIFPCPKDLLCLLNPSITAFVNAPLPHYGTSKTAGDFPHSLNSKLITHHRKSVIDPLYP
jgi:hypothetical protein